MNDDVIYEFCKIYNRYVCAKMVAGIKSDRESAIRSLNALEVTAEHAGINLQKEYLSFQKKARYETRL